MPSFTKKATLGGGLIITVREGGKVSLNSGEVLIEFVQVSGSYVKVCFKASREIKIDRLNAEATQPDQRTS